MKNDTPNKADNNAAYPYQPPGGQGGQNPTHVFVQGVGFIPSAPDRIETIAIRKTASIIGIGMLLFFLLNTFLNKNMVAFVSIITGIPKYAIIENAALLYLIKIVSFIATLLLPALFIHFAMPAQYVRHAAAKLNARLAVTATSVFLAASVINQYFSALIGLLTRSLGADVPAEPEIIPRGGAFFLYLIFIAVLPAILEEYLFRGVVLQSLRRFGDFYAIFISSMLFAVAHGNVLMMPNAFLSGVCFSFFAIRAGNLRLPMLMHLCNNLLAFLLSALSASVSPSVYFTVSSAAHILFLAAGLLSLSYINHKKLLPFELYCPATRCSTTKKVSIFSTNIFIVLFFMLVSMVMVARFF